MEDPRKALVRRYIEEVVNTGNLERVAEFITAADVEGAKKHVGAVRTTYPDLHVTVVAQIAEDDLVATRIVARGTHLGAFRGIEPTNKPVSSSPHHLKSSITKQSGRLNAGSFGRSIVTPDTTIRKPRSSICR
jgi:predicted ester cyclase